MSPKRPRQRGESSGIPPLRDRGNSLWHIYNRVQENLLRGGQKEYAAAVTMAPATPAPAGYGIGRGHPAK